MLLLFLSDGELLPPARHTVVGLGNLQITDLQPSDAGVYICSAGNVMAQAMLKVLGEHFIIFSILIVVELFLLLFTSCYVFCSHNCSHCDLALEQAIQL